MGKAIEILATGVRTLVQDAGRPGLAAVGVGRAGAADQTAYRLGGRLVGHGEDRAALEVTLGGLRLRAHGELTACLTGAAAPGRVDGRPVPHAAPFRMGPGQVLELGMPPTGLRTYVAFRGGIDVPLVLGSRSTDTLAGLGPAPVAAGDVLPIADAPEDLPHVDVAPVGEPVLGVTDLRVLRGPRHDWFGEPARLSGVAWMVSSASDRVGIRLEGDPIERHPALRDAELPSEGMVRGCIQVPPSGQPVIFLNDHPVTGGYPVIAVVRSADVDRAAQLVPGQQVRFTWERG
jgi:biotin-dependent carboxylase-like uncharacterized protein